MQRCLKNSALFLHCPLWKVTNVTCPLFTLSLPSPVFQMYTFRKFPLHFYKHGIILKRAPCMCVFFNSQMKYLRPGLSNPGLSGLSQTSGIQFVFLLAWLSVNKALREQFRAPRDRLLSFLYKTALSNNQMLATEYCHFCSKDCWLQKLSTGTSLVVPWLRLKAGSTGLIPGWGTKIPHASLWGPKIKVK